MINRMHSAHDVDLLHYIHQDLYFIINIVFINQYSVRFSLGKMQREDSFCKSEMMQFCFFSHLEILMLGTCLLNIDFILEDFEFYNRWLF